MLKCIIKYHKKYCKKILKIYFGFQLDFWFEVWVISMRLTPVLKTCSEVMLQEWLSMDAGFNLIEINHAYQEEKRILFSRKGSINNSINLIEINVRISQAALGNSLNWNIKNRPTYKGGRFIETRLWQIIIGLRILRIPLAFHLWL